MANAHCFGPRFCRVLGINYDYADGNHAPRGGRLYSASCNGAGFGPPLL